MDASEESRFVSSTPMRTSPLSRKSFASPLDTPQLDTRRERISIIANVSGATEKSIQRAKANANKLSNCKECFNFCIKLFQMNKITKDNVWDINLIHDFFQLTDVKDKMVVDDLNLASIAIDASAKIYALRVDDLHQDIVRLASGLSSNFKSSNKPTTENLHENDDDFEMKNDDPIATESEPRGKKVRNKKLKSQIVTDLSQIDKEVETIEELDKLFTCRAAMLGEGLSAEKVYRLTLGNAKGIFITSLEDYKDTSCHKIEKGTSNEDDDEEYPILALNMLDNANLNEALNTLRFLEWNPKDDSTLISHRNEGVLNSSQLELTFDVNAEVQKLPEPSAPEPMECEYNDNHSFFDNDEEEDYDISPPMVTSGFNSNVLRPTNQNLSKRSDYTVNPKIKNILSKLYAGPLHWKYPLMRKKKSLFREGEGKNKNPDDVHKVKSAKKSKTSAKIDLLQEINENIFKSRSLNKYKGYVLLNWNPIRNSLPVDLDITVESFNYYFMNKATSVFVENELDTVCIDEAVPEYNYENLNDSNFCAALNNEEAYSGDENGPTCTNKSDGFVDAPDLVDKVKITYDTKARTVNMKIVKRQTLKIIESHLKSKDGGTSSTEKYIMYSLVFKELHEQLPAVELTNLTQGIALLSVLHITNDNNLVLIPDNLDDFKISLPP